MLNSEMPIPEEEIMRHGSDESENIDIPKEERPITDVVDRHTIRQLIKAKQDIKNKLAGGNLDQETYSKSLDRINQIAKETLGATCLCVEVQEGFQGGLNGSIIGLENGNIAISKQQFDQEKRKITDSCIDIINPDDFKTVMQLRDPEKLADDCRSLIETKDGHIIAGSYDEYIRVWGKDGNFLRRFKTKSTVYALLELSDGRIASGVSHTGEVQLWDKDTGECLGTYIREGGGSSGSGDSIYTISELPDGRLACGGMLHRTGGIIIWNLESKQSTVIGDSRIGHSFIVTKDGYFLSNMGGEIEILDGKSLELLSTFEGHQGQRSYISAIVETEDGLIASVGDGNKHEREILFWNKETLEIVDRIKNYETTDRLALSKSGQIIAGSNSGKVRIWEKI